MPPPVSRIVPSPDDLQRAAYVITKSRLPLIYAGCGVMQSGAEDVLREFVEATNIPVVTSSGGKGALPDNHPLTYGSCLSPAAETQELNQLFDVMQSADVMIGVGARFSIGNPAGESCTLININIDDRDLTRVQANTLPLHGDAKATLEALLPYLKEAGAEERSSPAEGVEAARRLIAYYDIRQQEPQYANPGDHQAEHPRGDDYRLGRHPVRLLLPYTLPGEPTGHLHRLWLLVQSRVRIPHSPWGQGGKARHACGLLHR